MSRASKNVILNSSVFFALLLFYIADFRGISSYLDKAAADVNNALFASFYPAEYREEVIVVVADDHTVSSFKQPIPLTFSFHQDVISKLSLLQPRMLMIDYVFNQQHRGDPSGHRALEQQLNDMDIPVFLATNQNSLTPVSELVVRPSGNLKPVSIASFTNFRDKNKYCRNFSAKNNDGSGKCEQIANSKDPQKTVLPSAAWAMYKHDCTNGSISNSLCPDDIASLEHQPFRVIWGASPSPANRLLRGEKTCSAKWWSSFSDMFSQLDASGCAHHATITVNELFCLVRPLENATIVWEGDPDATEITNGEREGAESDEACNILLNQDRAAGLAADLTGKIIIYAGFFGTNLDIVDPPTTGAIAGAHFHAMAYDNLLTYAGQAKTDTARLGNFQVDALWVNVIFFTICWFSTLFITNRLQHFGIGKQYDAPHAITGFCSIAFILFLSVCYVWLSFFVFGLAPANWIGGILTSIVLPNAIHRLWRDGESVLKFLVDTLGAVMRRLKTSLNSNGE